MRKITLILAVAAVACVAANQADAGGVISYQQTFHAGAVPAVYHAGSYAPVQTVARVHRSPYGRQARYYGHGRYYRRPPVVVHPPVYRRPPVVVHPPIYRYPRVVVPHAYPTYVPRRGVSYHAPGISIGIGF